MFVEFHNNEIINQSTNIVFIALMPKKTRTRRISYHRPISLITSLYKIIAKVLSRQLRKVLQDTIFLTQGVFVERRQILDVVLIANELVDEKKRSREEGVVFKINFEKAYDHVDWGILDHVLERKSFSSKWRSWMRRCLYLTTFAISMNGNAKGWVKAYRGLRQGDPLSSFLFTIVVDVLSKLVVIAKEKGLFEGFLVSKNRTRVSHLQFVNNTIFFFRASLEELQSLELILLVFRCLSRLTIDLNKSTLSRINISQDQTARLASLLDCVVSEWLLMYLGLPLRGPKIDFLLGSSVE